MSLATETAFEFSNRI